MDINWDTNENTNTSNNNNNKRPRGLDALLAPPWLSAWPFARWNQHSLMDTGSVAEVTYFRSAIYFWEIKFGR